MSVTLDNLKEAAEAYGNAAKKVRNINEEITDKINCIHKEYTTQLSDAAIEAGEAYQLLVTLLDDAEAPEFFTKKKTLEFSGVKFGFQKGKGKTEVANEEKTIELLEKNYPELAEVCIAIKKSVIKDNLCEQSADTLKKLGVKIIDSVDKPIIKLTDSAVNKLLEAMIKESAKLAE